MTSIALRDVSGNAVCQTQGSDGMVFSDLESITAGVLNVMYEALDVSAVEKRAGVRLRTGCLLVFFSCPELHREYMRTSNPIERVFRELRRQQYDLGAHANRDACNRVVFGVFPWLNNC
jgi:hypothetical protein